MLIIGGTLLKDDLKAVADMVVGDRGTLRVAEGAGEVDERLRLTKPLVVDEDVEEETECDEEVDRR